MTEIMTCVLCGRRGVRDFEPVPGVYYESADAPREVQCANRDACERRQRETAEEAKPTEQEFATAASVAGLAREVEALRRIVQPMHGLAAQVEDLARVVGELAEQVQAKIRRPKPTPAPSWLDMPQDFAAANGLLRDLSEWMGEVYLRYADAAKGLPDCWLWHPDVVEELLWLMASWCLAYRAEDATVNRAGDWHDRYRPGVVRRIKQIVGTCSLENHLPRGAQQQSQPVVPVAEAMEPIAAWWAMRRGEPAPEPSERNLEQASTRHGWGGGRR
ncbi:hypothetical protein [Kutzneria kofuensis]|uniref:DUF4913 domain-containing protein n=1 Tax=Kutzneria kofuensis TaxID=103725 RepID=A0A7W9NGL4_9PSEU|nr:hypothetical protein [Kutzneria kofuensis]MBB5892627.1 hypothetical protein [Kutzneria kofuensis]